MHIILFTYIIIILFTYIMAQKTSRYEYPVKSVVLPKRLHSFLAYNTADPFLDATASEYHSIIDVFHPKLALPRTLPKKTVISIFQITVLPYLRHPVPVAFDKDTCIYSYFSTNAHLEHEKPYPTADLVLPQDLIKFLSLHDDPDSIVEATSKEYLRIITLFFPLLNLPASLNQETLISLFEVIVLPFFRRLEEFDEDSGFIRYLQFEVLHQIHPKVIPVQVVILPINLHKFLAFADPKVSVLGGPTNHEIHQIIKLFHPHLSDLWQKDENDMIVPFNYMVLPYLRNIISFNYLDGTLTYSAVDL